MPQSAGGQGKQKLPAAQFVFIKRDILIPKGKRKKCKSKLDFLLRILHHRVTQCENLFMINIKKPGFESMVYSSSQISWW